MEAIEQGQRLIEDFGANLGKRNIVSIFQKWHATVEEHELGEVMVARQSITRCVAAVDCGAMLL